MALNWPYVLRLEDRRPAVDRPAGKRCQRSKYDQFIGPCKEPYQNVKSLIKIHYMLQDCSRKKPPPDWNSNQLTAFSTTDRKCRDCLADLTT
jgi:hypothetical protein